VLQQFPDSAVHFLQPEKLPMTQGRDDPALHDLHADFNLGLTQGRQLHVIESIRNRFELSIPSTRFAVSPSVLLSQRSSGARTA
jgi:hypothetical protein